MVENNNNNSKKVVDVIYNTKHISGIADIKKRGIGNDLICHLVGNALAYKAGTHNSRNPIDYVTYSGNTFDIVAIKGLMDYLDEYDKDLFKAAYNVVISMRDNTSEMMLAAESLNAPLFFDNNYDKHNLVIGHIDILYSLIPDSWVQRCEEIKRHCLSTNSPSVRIKRLLQTRDKFEQDGKTSKTDEPDDE